MSNEAEPTNPGHHQDVERRAYELYEQRGREDGHDLDDWLAAERELRGSAEAEAAEVPREVAPASARRRRADQSQRESRSDVAQQV